MSEIIEEVEQHEVKLVRLEDDVHKELTELGKKSESYSDLIKRLIEHYKKSTVVENKK